MFEFRALSSCRAKFKLLQLIIRSTLFFIFCCSDNSNNQLATMQSQKKNIKPISLPWEFSAISARKRLWFREHLNMLTAITTTNILFTMPQARRPGGWIFFFWYVLLPSQVWTSRRIPPGGVVPLYMCVRHPHVILSSIILSETNHWRIGFLILLNITFISLCGQPGPSSRT